MEKNFSICKEVRKFSGLEGSRLTGFPFMDRARILKLREGKEIIYQQAYAGEGAYVLVPGYLMSGIISGENGKYCNVVPVIDNKEREYIQALLSAKTIGEVNFWN